MCRRSEKNKDKTINPKLKQKIDMGKLDEMLIACLALADAAGQCIELVDFGLQAGFCNLENLKPTL